MHEGDHDLLMRIDERTESLCGKIDSMRADLNENYVTQKEFWPVKAIVYGGSGLILVAVVGALIALVVRGVQ